MAHALPHPLPPSIRPSMARALTQPLYTIHTSCSSFALSSREDLSSSRTPASWSLSSPKPPCSAFAAVVEVVRVVGVVDGWDGGRGCGGWDDGGGGGGDACVA
eukprot:18114-Chlamydomonas_euryale.AAC.3